MPRHWLTRTAARVDRLVLRRIVWVDFMAVIIESEPRGLTPFDAKTVNMIRGKSLTLPPEIGREVRVLCSMIDWFESKLDETEDQDLLGTEGWRRFFGIGD